MGALPSRITLNSNRRDSVVIIAVVGEKGCGKTSLVVSASLPSRSQGDTPLFALEDDCGNLTGGSFGSGVHIDVDDTKGHNNTSSDKGRRVAFTFQLPCGKGAEGCTPATFHVLDGCSAQPERLERLEETHMITGFPSPSLSSVIATPSGPASSALDGFHRLGIGAGSVIRDFEPSFIDADVLLVMFRLPEFSVERCNALLNANQLPCHNDVSKILVGTMADLLGGERQSVLNDAHAFAKSANLPLCVTSAITGEGLDTLFETIASRSSGVRRDSGGRFVRGDADVVGRWHRAAGPGVVQQGKVHCSINLRDDQTCTVIESFPVANAFSTPPCYEGSGIWTRDEFGTLTITLEKYVFYAAANVAAGRSTRPRGENMGLKRFALTESEFATFTRSREDSESACCIRRKEQALHIP